MGGRWGFENSHTWGMTICIFFTRYFEIETSVSSEPRSTIKGLDLEDSVSLTSVVTPNAMYEYHFIIKHVLGWRSSFREFSGNVADVDSYTRIKSPVLSGEYAPGAAVVWANVTFRAL